MDDADAEDEDSRLFRELQVCPRCSGSRYTQRRIRGQENRLCREFCDG
jgi:hypothetical protein